MRSNRVFKLLPAGFGFGLVLASCTSGTVAPAIACGPGNVAAASYDVTYATNYEAAYYYAAADPLAYNYYVYDAIHPDAASVPPESVAAANDAAAAVGKYYGAGCATATASQNVVTYVLKSCSGVLAVASTSGTFTATYTTTGSGSITIQLSGSNISADGANLNLQSSATLTQNSVGQKTLEATSQSTGTGPQGNAVSHTGTYTLNWPTGNGCATLNASLTGIRTTTDANTSTKIQNYVVCDGKCPQSGTITSTYNGGTTTLTYNGSTNANCTSSIGTSATVPLTCP